MTAIELRLFGAFCAGLLVTGCAGNLQIPPPAANNPGNAAAGRTYDTTPEPVLASGPAAPVPDAIDTRMQHGGMQHMAHDEAPKARADRDAGMPHEGMRSEQGMHDEH